MARRPTPRQRIEALADDLEPGLRREFLAAVDDLRSNASVSAVVARLEAGDIEGALRALNIDRAAFSAFEEELRAVYIEGGRATADTLPPVPAAAGGELVLRFDVRNPRAERIIAEHSADLITRTTEDMREAARQALLEGQIAGRNPRSTALDIVGRINRATGRREGGILGLTAQQERYVSAARAELLSGDPEALRNYLTRARRDRRFDRQVLAAIRNERALDPATVSRMTGRYSDRLLQLRGETVARTETLTGLNMGANEAAEQMIERSALPRQSVRKVWIATRDDRTRDSHRDVDRDSVGVDERFSNGLLYPHQPGAPAAEVINCRCRLDFRVDYFANLT